MAIKKEKNKHLTDDQRLALEAALRERKSLSQIKREIMNRRVESTRTFYGLRFNPCVHRGGCQAPGMCGRPGCTRRCAVRLQRMPGRAEVLPAQVLLPAQARARGVPQDARGVQAGRQRHRGRAQGHQRGPRARPQQGTERLPRDALRAGLVRRGEHTTYNYINGGVLSVKRHNLPMAVRYKKRRGAPVEHKVDRHCAEGRSWGPFQDFLAENPGVQVPETNTVEGGRRDKCVLLTVMFARQGFMFARLMPGKCAQHAADAFNWMWRALGDATFRMLFPAVLADNGTEFSNPLAIETSPRDGTRRTRVFYTRPYTATDKAHVERNHEYVRRVAFKGESFDRLTQGQVDLMISHVNSYARASPMDDDSHPCRTPYERFAFEYGEEIARRLGIVPIPLKEVTLRPELLEVR